MYFKISKKQFFNTLSIVSRAISTFSPLPAFSGIKIEAFLDHLILTGSDSDISIQAKLDTNEEYLLEIKDTGSVVIEAKYILDIVRKIDSDDIEVEIIDGLLTKISGHSAEFKINGMSVNEYPSIDFTKPTESFTLEGEKLRTMILQTSFATSDKETRPVLTGVNFECKDTLLQCVGTDSYRLARKYITLDKSLHFNVTIPSRSLNEISKIIESEDVEIAVNDKKVQFLFDNILIQTRLIDGIYPETSRLIPQSFDYQLTIDSKDLLDAIDRASFIKNDGVSVIKFSLDEKECVLSSKSVEVGSSTEILSSASFEGNTLEISCNGRYVFDAIKYLNGSLVKFSFCGDMKPFIIQTINDDSVLQLILPVRTYA
ncbi:MAG: DNA polymerase III subunit beta [Erysipelotrichaceae bacterium]|nr:DNA polymerase III subunit beta [Erysipelotrichaceae bacterium]